VLAFYSGIGYYIQARSIGQAVKTPPSHGGNRGSIPLSTAETSGLGVRRGLGFLFFYGNLKKQIGSKIGSNKKVKEEILKICYF
jgi:hypothetical protein